MFVEVIAEEKAITLGQIFIFKDVLEINTHESLKYL